MDITHKIGGPFKSSGRIAESARQAGIVDMGICYPFVITRPDGDLIGIAWPCINPAGSILVGAVVFEFPEGRLSKQQVESTWRHNQNALKRQVAETFKKHLEEVPT
ncbi:MAG: hypothetical protein F6K42_27885 [Leptolyngbya sp. SIO1D8]|nr:hypothetical protein [Leptolyngbya sp. SIO1D8]